MKRRARTRNVLVSMTAEEEQHRTSSVVVELHGVLRSEPFSITDFYSAKLMLCGSIIDVFTPQFDVARDFTHHRTDYT